MTAQPFESPSMAEFYELVALKGAVMMEKAGMHRSRTPSATVLARQKLLLPSNIEHDDLLRELQIRINAAIDARHRELQSQ